MDEATFQKELSKYKIVRLADHYKIRWKHHKKTAEKPRAPIATSTNTTSGKAVVAADSGASFWTLIESINANLLSEAEMKKFMEALRAEHPNMMSAVNLEDLEYMASQL